MLRISPAQIFPHIGIAIDPKRLKRLGNRNGSPGWRQEFDLQPGTALGKDLRVSKVTESGIWITAGKEKSFIQVSSVHKPSGLPTKDS